MAEQGLDMLPVKLPQDKPKRLPVELPTLSRAALITGTAQSDAVVDVYVHSGWGKTQGQHVYMGGHCRTDFTDVWFEDEAGNRLDYYLVSAGNWSVEPDARIGIRNYIVQTTIAPLSTGDIISLHSGPHLRHSTDGGNTWTTIWSSKSAVPLGMDALGNLYVSIANDGLYRGVWNGTSWDWTRKIDFSGDAYRAIQPYAFDVYGARVLVGLYETPVNNATIYVSVNNGVDWTTVDTGLSAGHVHGLHINPATGDVYAGVDRNPEKLLKGVWNVGTTSYNWSEIGSGNTGMSITGMTFLGDGTALIGSPPFANLYGNCIRSLNLTTNAITTLLREVGTAQDIVNIGGIIVANLQPIYNSKYCRLIASADNGATWQTIWIGQPDTTSFNGLSWACPPVTANGESMTLFGTNGEGYTPTRVYAGRNRYQAFYKVKLPTLGVQGHTIYACCDGVTRTSGSTVTAAHSSAAVDAIYANSCVARWTFEASNGAPAIGTHTLLPIGADHSYGSVNGPRAGSAYPPIQQSGKCLTLAATGFMKVATSADALDLTASFTTLGWVNLEPRNGIVQYLFGRGNADSNGQWVLIVSHTAPYVMKLLCGNTSTYKTYDSEWYPANGTWQQVGLRVSANVAGAQHVHIINNGQVGTQIDLSPAIADTTRHWFAVGNSPFDNNDIGAYAAVGSFDDIAVWNRILTDTELRTLYEARADLTLTAKE